MQRLNVTDAVIWGKLNFRLQEISESPADPEQELVQACRNFVATITARIAPHFRALSVLYDRDDKQGSQIRAIPLNVTKDDQGRDLFLCECLGFIRARSADMNSGLPLLTVSGIPGSSLWYDVPFGMLVDRLKTLYSLANSDRSRRVLELTEHLDAVNALSDEFRRSVEHSSEECSCGTDGPSNCPKCNSAPAGPHGSGNGI